MNSRQNKWKLRRRNRSVHPNNFSNGFWNSVIYVLFFIILHIQYYRCIDSMVSLFCRYLNNNYRMQYVPVALTTQEKLPAIVNLYLDDNVITLIETETFTNISTLRSL